MAIVELEFAEKYEELIGKTIDNLKEEGLCLFRSGAVDPSSYENDYQLPKIILTVALEKMAREWSPHTDEGRRELANLRKF